MKKFLRRAIALASIIVLLFASSCKGEENGYNYSKKSLVIEEVQQVAPCGVLSFIRYNDHAMQQLFIALHDARNIDAITIEVDGVTFSNRIDIANYVFPEGQHVLRVKTVKGYTYPKIVKGERKEIPYNKAITLTLDVSSTYPDLANLEYRIENGLWTVPSNAPWYPDFEKKYLK